MVSGNEKLRSRLQLSRLLHGIEMGIEEILIEKTPGERESLEGSVLELVPQGCKKFVTLMEGNLNDAEDTERDKFLLSPHGVSLVDALTLALAGNDRFTFRQQAELFASLANLLLAAIPWEMKWAVTEHEDFQIVDPLELIEITVWAADAMNAMHEARHLKSADSIPDEELAKKVAEAISEQARRRADVTHRINRATRQQAYEWLAKNLSQFKSQTAAAEALGKIIPMEYSTRLGYVKDFKKMNKPA